MLTNRGLDQLERAQQALLRLSQKQGRAQAQHELDALPLFSRILGYTPSFDEALSVFLRNFTGWHVPKSRPVHAMNIEVVLSPEQAARGGHLPIRVPVFAVCERCQGTGRDGFFTCDRCGGGGMIEDFHEIDLLIPSGLKTEMVVPVSLRPLGICSVFLNVRVRPSEQIQVV